MAKAPQSAFVTVRSEGGLLPSDLLARIATSDADIGGVLPADYGLEKGVRLADAIAQSWAACKMYWPAFKMALARRGEGDSGVTETREQWILPLFRELGYGRLWYHRAPVDVVDGRSFPISHRAGDGPDAPPIHIVAAIQDLDRGEGRRTVDGLRVSPQGLMQDYLNRTPHLWGIVTNGRRLRLLRDSESLTRAAYLEFDLEAMMEDGVYSDFVLLYLVLHRSRLPHGTADALSCWLERWRVAAVEGGTRALDSLREGVAAALAALGEGFLAHPANEALRERLASGDLTVTAYYQQLLRLVYRILFLLVAEERDLLFTADAPARLRSIYADHYSVSRLRPLAEQRARADIHDDLWQSLRLTFAMMGDGNTALDLAPLAGGLFNAHSCPDLDNIGLRNDTFLSAIRGLSLVTIKGVRRRVNYRDLNVEELGSVYESLLDLHPSLRTNGGGMIHFDFMRGSERKTTGSYYTPSSLVDEVVKSTLDPLIARIMDGQESAPEKRRRLLALTLCDAACGSGHFLLAGARRIAREVARFDAGNTEPDVEMLHKALREVIQHCIYGVDLNPLAVDLCRLALWIEGHLPGRPLTFLDHRIKRGNALVGATADLVAGGIPGDAYMPVTGDNKGMAAAIKKRNAVELEGQGSFFHQLQTGPVINVEPSDDEALATMELAAVDEANAHALREKEERYAVFRSDEGYVRKLVLANAWVAAFFWRLAHDNPDPPTTDSIARLRRGEAGLAPIQWDVVQHLAKHHGFFHWALEFPDVFGGSGGFDCVVGNPPWERIKLQEQEFFATRNPAIATAVNAAVRKRLIDALPTTDPALALAFDEAKHAAEAQSKFARASGHFPLTAIGDVNTYALFAEQFRDVLAPKGRAGIICPTGIATDDSTKQFFGNLVQKRALISLVGFENEANIFPAVHHFTKFLILTMTGSADVITRTTMIFFCRHFSQLQERRRLFSLTPEDIEMINPNTRTCPIFRTHADAELTKAIYHRVPVLVNETKKANPWGVRFLAMFHMANDSGSFCTNEHLEAEGWTLDGNVFHRGDDVFLPLYEAKMLHQYDHRWVTYDGAETRDLTLAEKANPSCVTLPRYWVPQDEVEARLSDRRDHGWLLGFRNITNATNERTTIFNPLPRVAVAHSAPLIFLDHANPRLAACFLAAVSSLPFDYVVRQKLGGTNMTFGYIRQFPVLPPAIYNRNDVDYIVPRVLELVYTAWDMQPFARDLGYGGPPFTWDEGRRALLRAELDAYYARLYGLTRKQLRYILDPHDLTDRELEDILDPTEDPPDTPRTKDFPGETFRVLKEREMKQYGEYRTKRLVLEAWGNLAHVVEGRL